MVAIAAATTVYLGATLFLFAFLAMEECLPRSDPEIYLCDMHKQREGLIYLVLFLANSIIAVVLGRKKKVEVGLAYLVGSSLVPFAAALAYGFVVAGFQQ